MKSRIKYDSSIPRPCSEYPDAPLTLEYFEHVTHCDQCQLAIGHMNEEVLKLILEYTWTDRKPH